MAIRANDLRPTSILRHGAYVCLQVPKEAGRKVAKAGVAALAESLGLVNEFEPREGHPPEAFAFLRRAGATPADIVDDRLLRAHAVVHVASASTERVARFCAGVARLLGPAMEPLVLGGIVRPTMYTGNAMHDFAYAHQVIQQPGCAMPNAFLVPMCKTAEWWAKPWMERHTYFLPRYDDGGKMVHEGHALAAAEGISCLMRRTYRHEIEPAPAGAYDFLNYFEAADADVPTFHAVCTALRDPAKNPEWRFVREGPTWRGRRVATWPELFA